MKFIVKAMSEEDRVKEATGYDDGGEELLPIGTIESPHEVGAQKKLKQLIAQGVYPWDAVCDEE